MGVVYSANDTRLNRPVALKMILDSGNDEDGRKRFVREGRAEFKRILHVAQVRHQEAIEVFHANGGPALLGQA
jgi:serine/threonine protein kinase